MLAGRGNQRVDMPPGHVSGGFQELVWAVYERTSRTPHNQPTIANKASLCLLSKSLQVSVSIVTAIEMLLKVREQFKGAIERDEKSGSKQRSIEYILAKALMAPVGAMGKRRNLAGDNETSNRS
jgi:hypothetical protein